MGTPQIRHDKLINYSAQTKKLSNTREIIMHDEVQFRTHDQVQFRRMVDIEEIHPEQYRKYYRPLVPILNSLYPRFKEGEQDNWYATSELIDNRKSTLGYLFLIRGGLFILLPIALLESLDLKLPYPHKNDEYVLAGINDTSVVVKLGPIVDSDRHHISSLHIKGAGKLGLRKFHNEEDGGWLRPIRYDTEGGYIAYERVKAHAEAPLESEGEDT